MKAPAAAAADKPVVAPKGASDSITKSFEKLAAEKAQVRQMQQEAAPYLQLKNMGVDPGTMSVVARAISARDPVGVLTAFGFSHDDYVGAVVGKGSQPARQGEPAKPQPAQAESELRQELQALKAQLQQLNIARGREELSGKVKAQLDGFQYAKGFGDEATQQAISLLEQFAAQSGKLPGDTVEESIKIALEAVEENYAKQAARWKGILTPASTQPTVPAEAPALPPQVESVGPPKTLTNSLASPAPVIAGARKRTSEDYVRETLALLGNNG